MVGETKMSDQNGSVTMPGKTAARHTAKLMHDALTLAELQAELLKVEAQQRLAGAVKPGVLLIAALSLALGCVPVLLLGLAYSLTDIVGLARALSLLIVTVVGLVAAAAGASIAIGRLKKLMDFSRSYDEFNRNVNWIKQVLKHKCSPANESGRDHTVEFKSQCLK